MQQAHHREERLSEQMEETKVKYRHELKYVSSEKELALVKNRLDALMSLDSHVKEKGIYTIRSLYFDDYDNRCYGENEAGTDPREKFRIRIYNGSAERISLELKKKERGKTLKLSCPITKEQCRQLMRGQPLPFDNGYPPLLLKLLLQMRTRLLRPAVIVEYDRVPYVCRDGNVRITMDKNISSSNQLLGFLEPEIARRPVMERGSHILEVKYDEYLPDYIKNSLELGTLRQTSFSKFYLCRYYHM